MMYQTMLKSNQFLCNSKYLNLKAQETLHNKFVEISMDTLTPQPVHQQDIRRHTSAHQSVIANVTDKAPHFSIKVSLVSGDFGNYFISIIHRDEALRLFHAHKAYIPETHKRNRNINKLFVHDHFPKQEESRNANSSKTTYVERLVVTPGCNSPRFQRVGQSIMGIVYQHKPISIKSKELYAVRQVG